jgi:type I restriction enzyme S subunit
MSWEMKRLVDVCDFQGGTQPPKSEWSTQDKKGFVRMIQIRDFTQGKDKFIEYVKDSKNLKKCIDTDIMIGRYGASIGKILTGLNGAYNVALVKTIPSNQLDKNYFYHYLNTPYFQNFIQNAGSRAAQAGFNKEELKDLEIPLPPLPIQMRIAEILDAADALKRKDQELLKKYDELAQAIFIDMFGDPVNNEKGWEVKKLKEISTKIHSGNTPIGGSNVYVKSGITFFRSQNVWKNNLVYDDIAFIDEKTHLSMMKSSLKHKDILMTKTGRINTENSSLGRAALFLGDDDSANVNGHVYLIRLQKNQVHEFVVHILTTKEYRGLIRDVCVGGIDKRQLNKDHIEDFPIIYPPLITQQKFAIFLKNIQTQKQNVEKSAKESEGIFNSLIQKAFSGELVN